MKATNVVHLPTADEMAQAKESSRTLSKYADADRVKMSLEGSGGERDTILLPGNVTQLLLDILSSMAQGKAVNLIPLSEELTTQQAAEFLNVSRPHLVKMLENNEIPFRKVGTHRRVLLCDLLTYKEKITEKRNETLDKLAAFSQEIDMEY